MFFNRNKRPREPLPSWVKWAVLLFLALAFIGNVRNKNAPDAMFHQAAENLSPKKLLPLDSYKSIFSSRAGTTLNIKDIAAGTGAPAICGQQVTVGYEVFAADKPVGAGQTSSFHIGDGKVIPALEQGVAGMKKGGKRSIFSPPNMAYGTKEFARDDIPAQTPVRFEVELLDANPEIEELGATPYRIATVKAGHGGEILCGTPGKFKVTLWSVDGKKLFSTKDKDEAVGFTPGKSEVFLGLEQGVIGLAKGGVRTLIVPPALQKTMNGNPPTVDFPLPKDQTVLVDVEALP